MCGIFGTKTAHLSWKSFFWHKPLLLLSSTYGPFHCTKFKINLTMDPELWMLHHFWAQSGPFTSNKFFFRKPLSEPCFFCSCLSTRQKSKSDVNLLVKYWWFKDTEISLAESHVCLYLRTRFFPSMQFCQDVNEP